MWRTFHLAFTYRLLAASKCCQATAQHRRWASQIKMTKGLQKMFDRQGGKKKKFIYPGSISSGHSEDRDLNPRKKVVYTEGKKRRAQQVGRVLYDHIVQLVNSGELSPEIAGYAVEIVKVKVIPDFSAVNVYWLSSGTNDDAKLEILLKQHEGHLRHLLTSHYILGHIPRINFVRDDSRSHYLKVEELLSKADFGPDFIPTRLDTTIRDDILLQKDRELEKTSLETQLQEDFVQMNLDHHLQGTDRAGSSSGDVALKIESLEREEDKRQDFGLNVRESVTEVKKGHETSADESVVTSASRLCEPMDVKSSSGASISSGKGRMPLPEEREAPAIKTSPSAFSLSSLEVSDLGKQILGESPDATLQIGESPDATLQRTERNRTDSAKTFEGFRDDVYGVPHTELMNKVLARKNKIKPRPTVAEPKYTLENVGAAVEANALKSKLARKKAKSKDSSIRDYEKAILMDYHGNRLQQEANEALHDDYLDLDEDDTRLIDDDYGMKK